MVIFSVYKYTWKFGWRFKNALINMPILKNDTYYLLGYAYKGDIEC